MMILGFMDSFILTSHCPLAAASGARTRAQHAAARWCALAPHAAARAPVRGVIGVAGAVPRSSVTPLRPSSLLQLPLPSPLRRARARGARAFGAPGRAGGPAPCAAGGTLPRSWQGQSLQPPRQCRRPCAACRRWRAGAESRPHATRARVGGAPRASGATARERAETADARERGAARTMPSGTGWSSTPPPCSSYTIR